jgi:hypothetical protein
MGYSTAEGAYLLTPGVAGGPNVGSTVHSMNIWGYQDTDALATVIGTGYFSDGNKLGMRPLDVIHFARLSTAGVPAAYHSLMISSVSTNGASATVIGSSSS